MTDKLKDTARDLVAAYAEWLAAKASAEVESMKRAAAALVEVTAARARAVEEWIRAGRA